MLICKYSSPARFNRSMRSFTSKYPFVINPETIRLFRIREMIASSSGCSSGSPPLIVIMEVPKEPSRSIRRNISSVGTGFEKSSNSLQ